MRTQDRISDERAATLQVAMDRHADHDGQCRYCHTSGCKIFRSTRAELAMAGRIDARELWLNRPLEGGKG